MARLAGMTNPGSASNAMRAIRRKLDAHMPSSGTETNDAISNSNPSTPRKPKTPRTAGGRKRSAASMMEELTPTGSFFDRDDELYGDEVRASVESPSKRKRGGGKPARHAVRVKEEVVDEEEEEERGTTHHDDGEFV